MLVLRRLADFGFASFRRYVSLLNLALILGASRRIISARKTISAGALGGAG